MVSMGLNEREAQEMVVEARKAVMSPEELKGHLRGALAFPITPFKADGTVDLDGVRANARWLPESGVCAIVAPSGTGELFALSPDECAAVARATVEAVAGRVPVIASVGFGVGSFSSTKTGFGLTSSSVGTFLSSSISSRSASRSGPSGDSGRSGTFEEVPDMAPP